MPRMDTLLSLSCLAIPALFILWPALRWLRERGRYWRARRRGPEAERAYLLEETARLREALRREREQ